jgi:hypothetical protein
MRSFQNPQNPRARTGHPYCHAEDGETQLGKATEEFAVGRKLDGNKNSPPRETVRSHIPRARARCLFHNPPNPNYNPRDTRREGSGSNPGIAGSAAVARACVRRMGTAEGRESGRREGGRESSLCVPRGAEKESAARCRAAPGAGRRREAVAERRGMWRKGGVAPSGNGARGELYMGLRFRGLWSTHACKSVGRFFWFLLNFFFLQDG